MADPRIGMPFKDMCELMTFIKNYQEDKFIQMERKNKSKKARKKEIEQPRETTRSKNDDVQPCHYDSEFSVTLGVLTTALYIVTLYPSVPGGDSGELITAAYELGVAHPPGYPLFTLLANCIIRVIPYGSIAWRVNLLTAICGGIASAFLSKLVIKLTGRLSCGALAVGLWCWCKLTWTWSITSEVFSLNNLFITSIMKLSVDFYQASDQFKQKIALCGSFLCGLSLCNQHTIVVYNFILILWVLIELKQSKLMSITFLLKLSVSFIIGLLPYLYLPLSAYYSQARWTWGDQRTINGIYKHLLRTEYGTFNLSKDGHHQGIYQSLRLYAIHISNEMTVIALLLFGVGAVLITYRFIKKTDRVNFIFLLMMIVYTVLFSWRANLDVNKPLMYGVVERFWMQSDIIVIVVAAVAFDSIIKIMEEKIPLMRKTFLDKLVVMVLISFQLYRNYSICDQSKNVVIAEFGMDMMKRFPQGSLVLTKGDLPSNTFRYLYLCENVRPDLELFDQEVLTYDWSVTMMKKAYQGIVFPGHHMFSEDAIKSDGRIAFTFKKFLDANYKSNRVFGCIGAQDHENSWKNSYDLLLFGVCSQFVKKGDDIDISEYVQQTQHIAENWTHPYNGFEDSSWERVTTNEMWTAKISSAFQLYQLAEQTTVERKKSKYFTASYQLYDSAIRKIRKNAEIPSYWHKNFALVCERILHIESNFNKIEILRKVILHFEWFLKKDPTDEDCDAIKQAVTSMKKQLKKN